MGQTWDVYSSCSLKLECMVFSSYSSFPIFILLWSTANGGYWLTAHVKKIWNAATPPLPNFWCLFLASATSLVFSNASEMWCIFGLMNSKQRHNVANGRKGESEVAHNVLILMWQYLPQFYVFFCFSCSFQISKKKFRLLFCWKLPCFCCVSLPCLENSAGPISSLWIRHASEKAGAHAYVTCTMHFLAYNR